MRSVSICARKEPPKPPWTKSLADIIERGKKDRYASRASSWNVIVFCSSNVRLPRGRESLSACQERKWESTHMEGCRDPSAVRQAGAQSLDFYTFRQLYNCIYDPIQAWFSELKELQLLML